MAVVGTAIAALVIAPYATPLYLYYWSTEDTPYEPRHKKPVTEEEQAKLNAIEAAKPKEEEKPWFSFSIFEDSDPISVASATMSLGAARTAEPNKLIAKSAVATAYKNHKLSSEEVSAIRDRYPRQGNAVSSSFEVTDSL